MLLIFADSQRDLDGNPDVKIAALAGTGRQSFASDAQLMSLLSASRNFQ
jgi:hypothetical protein